MATIPETVIFCGTPFTGTTTSGVVQAITMPTITLPENNKTFVSVILKLWWTDAATTATNITVRRVDLGLGGGAKAMGNATQAITNSGENIPGYTSYDLTSKFVSSWSGTSMTCELDVTITGPAVRNIVAHLVITYTHDDTATTRVKTVRVPLNAPVGTLATAKPASLDTVPALDTYCPESTKTFLGTWVDLEWCMGTASGTVDQIVSMELSSLGAHSTGSIEMALATSMALHYTWDATIADKSVTQTWHLWTTTTAYIHHVQASLLVTYTYDADATTTVLHSIELPLELASPLGVSSTYPTRGVRDVWIGEASPTLQKLAAFVWWQSTGAMAGFNWRIGTGSYVTYTDGGSVYAGSNCLMIRNDAAYTLSRGRNTIELSGYSSSGATNLGNLGAVILINYTSAKMPGGVGAHTRTVQRCLHDFFDGGVAAASSSTRTVAGADGQVAICPPLSDDHFIVGLGIQARVMPLGGANMAGWRIAAQKDSGAGWHPLYDDVGCSDAETGPVMCVAQVRDWFTRWHGDAGLDRQNIETARRWKFTNSTVNAAAQAVLFDAIAFTTFHLHTWTVAGTVSGSSGGEVEVTLNRYRYRTMSGVTGDASSEQITTPSPHWLSVGQPVFVSSANGAGLAAGAFYTVATVVSATVFTLTGVNITSNVTAATIELPTPSSSEVVLRTTRTGDGSFSLTWYDETEPLFLAARDMVNASRRTVTDAFIADSGVTHSLRLWHPPGGRVIDATVVRKAGG